MCYRVSSATPECCPVRARALSLSLLFLLLGWHPTVSQHALMIYIILHAAHTLMISAGLTPMSPLFFSLSLLSLSLYIYILHFTSRHKRTHDGGATVRTPVRCRLWARAPRRPGELRVPHLALQIFHAQLSWEGRHVCVEHGVRRHVPGLLIAEVAQ